MRSSTTEMTGRTTNTIFRIRLLVFQFTLWLGMWVTTTCGFTTPPPPAVSASRVKTTTTPHSIGIRTTICGRAASANEWGIPHPDDLPILSDTVVSTLPNGGKISLIGAGPGDPELLTLKAIRLLTTPADDDKSKGVVVVADRLVAPEILDLLPSTIELHVARKLPGCAELAQDEIYAWCHEGLVQGKHVIRLKIGDPFVFGRGGEEVLQFRQYGVEPEVVPGVSSAFSAPLLGGIPVTHRVRID